MIADTSPARAPNGWSGRPPFMLWAGAPGRFNLPGHQPIEQVADRREPLLHARRRELGNADSAAFIPSSRFLLLIRCRVPLKWASRFRFFGFSVDRAAVPHRKKPCSARGSSAPFLEERRFEVPVPSHGRAPSKPPPEQFVWAARERRQAMRCRCTIGLGGTRPACSKSASRRS